MILTSVGGRGVFCSIGLSLRGRHFRRDDYRGCAKVLIDVLNEKASGLSGRSYPVLCIADVAPMPIGAITADAHVYDIIRMAFLCRTSDTDLARKRRSGLLPPDFGMDRKMLAAAIAPPQPA